MRLLRERKFTCSDEVYCIDSKDSTRYADIIAFFNTGRTALILDPTDLRAMTSIKLRNSVRPSEREREFTVRGLWFGSRGTIPKRTRKFLEELGVDIKDVARLAENTVLDSLGIIHPHVHG
ncbi:unnamed protein product [Nezara viridula]|uniref:Uncharacterized protein n=1 Tax=Nezara viridula TaxID=85310 RepID=A0A9P0HUH6_NEZVI|nr:unnamed protein product [Nezara viridula]